MFRQSGYPWSEYVGKETVNLRLQWMADTEHTRALNYRCLSSPEVFVDVIFKEKSLFQGSLWPPYPWYLHAIDKLDVPYSRVHAEWWECMQDLGFLPLTSAEYLGPHFQEQNTPHIMRVSFPSRTNVATLVLVTTSVLNTGFVWNRVLTRKDGDGKILCMFLDVMNIPNFPEHIFI